MNERMDDRMEVTARGSLWIEQWQLKKWSCWQAKEGEEEEDRGIPVACASE